MNKVYNKAAIQSVVDDYRLSEIQSESEVRSKFIVRLSEALGYPSQLRGEEFPVYGYGGREALRAKDADFIRVMVENESGLQMVFPSGHPGKMWMNKQHIKTMFEFWLSGMEKLKAIEEYYEIKFELQVVSDPVELNDLYEAIDFVYDVA